ncbi:MAG TPA: type IX secretion system plug protein domain-containing protein, partial [Bacteroidia bacterium]|nr:type IX secretion system plug protein domain-containing protein [Bacteroidia bacterium]
ESMKLTKSGNYLLKVYLDYDANDLVLTKRFMVVDERVNILADIHHATIVNDYNYKQEIDFSIQTPGYQIINPYNDLKVVITQNDRWDNAITKLKPLFIKNEELVYDYDHDNVFSGGNEFRNFDIKSLHWNSEFVRNMFRDSLGYHVILFPGKKRSYYQYLSDRDINGKYKITRQESSPNGSVTEAEYVNVHVTLSMEQIENGSIYILGGFNNWRYNNDSKMSYNKDLKQYEKILFIKQGYYNYMFTYLKDEEKFGDETLVEGQHYETENEYCIYVYYKPITSNHDQLIGIKRFNSIHY